MRRNMQAWKDELIRAPRKRAMPILSFPAISLMGVSVQALCTDAQLQAQGIQLVAQRLDSAAAVSMMDLSVEAEAFGAQARFAQDEVPTITQAIVRTPEDAKALQVPARGAGRSSLYVEAIGKACQLITDRPVLAGLIGPFSLAGRLMDVSEIMINCYDEPEAVHLVMEKATAFLIDYARAFRDVGAHGVVIAEPLTGLLSPALAEEFSEPYVRRLSDSCRAEDFLVIYHNCGDNTPRMMDSILRTNCDGYHFGDAVQMQELVGQVPGDRLVMGNISPSAQFLGGSPESIREATLQLLAACAPGHPHFVISSGCDIPPRSPWANIDAFFAAVAEYYDDM